MTSFHYTTLSRKELTQAEQLVTAGDYHQASEKFWGAAALMVKAVAEARGWKHDGHRELYLVVSRLARGSENQELVGLFSSASALHMNYYEDWFPGDQVEELGRRVRLLTGQLEEMGQAPQT